MSIDQANGTADQALPVPAQASQRNNRRLSDIALTLIREAGNSRSPWAGQVPGGLPAPSPAQREAAADRRDLAADARDRVADDRDRAADRHDVWAQLHEAVAADQPPGRLSEPRPSRCRWGGYLRSAKSGDSRA